MDLARSAAPVAVAFVEADDAITMVIAAGPNEAGVESIDLSQGADAGPQVVIRTTEGDVVSNFRADGIGSTRFPDGSVVSTQPAGDGVDLLLNSELVSHFSAAELDAAQRQFDDDLADAISSNADEANENAMSLVDPLGLRSMARSVLGQEENPLEYFVDRPVRINASVTVGVQYLADDPVAFAEAAHFGIIHTQQGCELPVCSSGPIDGSAVRVTAVAETPPPTEARESIGIFASRERCEAFRGLNSDIASTLGWANFLAPAPYAAAAQRTTDLAVASRMNHIAAVLTVATFVAGQVFSKPASVPCGVIAVADELVRNTAAQNAGKSVEISVTSAANDPDTLDAFTFSTETIKVFPFRDNGTLAGTVTIQVTAPTSAVTGEPETTEAQDEPTPPVAAPFPWVFHGTGLATQQIEMTFGAQENFSWQYQTDIRLVLNADGTVEFTETPAEQLDTRYLANCTNGQVASLPNSSQPQPVTRTGTHSNGTLAVGEPGDSGAFEGTYNDDFIEAEYTSTGASDCDGAGTVNYTSGRQFRIQRIDE